MQGLLRDGWLEKDVAEFIIEDTSLPDTVNAPAGGKEVYLSLLLEEEPCSEKGWYLF